MRASARWISPARWRSSSRHESCGQCTPCREGTPADSQNPEPGSGKGKGSHGDLDFLERLGQVMMDASFCPLGQTAPAPLMSLLKNFRQEFEDHISGKCQAGVCRVI